MVHPACLEGLLLFFVGKPCCTCKKWPCQAAVRVLSLCLAVIFDPLRLGAMRSLQFKIVTPFLLGSLLLTTFLSWYTYTSTQKAVADSVLLISKAQTKNVGNSMSLFFRSMSTSAEKMTTDPHLASIFPLNKAPTDALAADDWFEILVQGNEYYRSILAVDTNGVCIASNSQMQVGVSYADRPYVQAALDGELVLNDVNIGIVTKNLSATSAAPVYMNGTVVGAIILVNDFPDLVQYEDSDGNGIQAVFTALLAPDGAFRAHKENGLVRGAARFPELYAQFASLGAGGGAVEYTLNGKVYMGYAVIEPTTGWAIISSGLKLDLFSQANSLSIVVCLVSVLVLCLISFGVILVVKGVLQSLFSLIEYAKKVAGGDLTLKLADSTRNDELATLHRSLQTLVEAMREMMAKFQEASKMKSEFLANMSHEIRTPLNAVLGMAHLYLADNSVSEKKRDYIVKIQMAAQSLLGIINNILDISKIEAGMFELDHTPFNLRTVIEHVAVIHHGGAAAKGLILTVNYGDDVPQSFVGDPTRIGQVLNNLTGNAVKFSEFGSVDIQCSLAEPYAGGAFALVRVCVHDTGMGIAPGQLDKLFSPFTQADASITRRFGGTGLGLAISDKIVKMFGGEFDVQSTVGAGTSFCFTMRLEVRACAEEESNLCQSINLTDALTQLNLGGKRILVAEDNEINQMIIEEMLAPTGAEVVTVENGMLAVEAVREGAFDLVLMDLQMPVMGGIQATREIRLFIGHEALPIVAVTANAMQEDKSNGFSAGLNDYITKPIEPQQLIAVLKTWLCNS